jgi:hypothetical protein
MAFTPDLRKLPLRPSGQHDAAIVSMARRLEPLPHAHRTQTDGAGAGGTRRPLLDATMARQHSKGTPSSAEGPCLGQMTKPDADPSTGYLTFGHRHGPSIQAGRASLMNRVTSISSVRLSTNSSPSYPAALDANRKCFSGPCDGPHGHQSNRWHALECSPTAYRQAVVPANGRHILSAEGHASLIPSGGPNVADRHRQSRPWRVHSAGTGLRPGHLLAGTRSSLRP